MDENDGDRRGWEEEHDACECVLSVANDSWKLKWIVSADAAQLKSIEIREWAEKAGHTKRKGKGRWWRRLRRGRRKRASSCGWARKSVESDESEKKRKGTRGGKRKGPEVTKRTKWNRMKLKATSWNVEIKMANEWWTSERKRKMH